MNEGQLAQDKKTSGQPLNATERMVEWDTSNPHTVEGRSSCSRESDQQRQTGGQDRMDMFLSESVLRTQHEKVVLYPESITDLLSAIHGRGHANTKQGSRVYCKWIHLHRPNREKVCMQAVIDGGAMRNTMCTSIWHTQKHQLAPLTPSEITVKIWISLRNVNKK